MSGETEHNVSGWTIDTLRTHFTILIDERDRRYQERFDAQEMAMNAALTAAKEAVAKAELAIGERLKLLNEFRGQAEEQSKSYPRADAVDTRFASLEKELSTLTARIERSEGRGSGLHAGWIIFVGAIGVIATLLTIYTLIPR